MKTVTLTEAIAALERHVGFRRGRLVAVAKRLQSAEMIPTGGPRTAPQLDMADVVRLVIAYVADAPIHASARSVEIYGAMTLAGAVLEGGPSHLGVTAGERLHAYAELSVDGNAGLRKSKLEFVSTWPELAIHFEDGRIQRFREVGALGSHWGAGGHRKSIVINGAAFADAFQELFR